MTEPRLVISFASESIRKIVGFFYPSFCFCWSFFQGFGCEWLLQGFLSKTEAILSVWELVDFDERRLIYIYTEYKHI